MRYHSIHAVAYRRGLGGRVLGGSRCVLGRRRRVLRLGRSVLGGGGMVGLCLGVDRGSLVLDISNIAVVVISRVGHSLHSAIGQVDGVAARDDLGVRRLIRGKVGARVVVVHSVLVLVRLCLLLVHRRRLVWSRWRWGAVRWGRVVGGNGSGGDDGQT